MGKLLVNLIMSLCHSSTLAWSILTPVGTLGTSLLTSSSGSGTCSKVAGVDVTENMILMSFDFKASLMYLI